MPVPVRSAVPGGRGGFFGRAWSGPQRPARPSNINGEPVGEVTDPLAPLATIVPWESFRPRLERHWPKQGRRAHRRRWDAVFMFKALVFGALHDLPDEAVAYLATDSRSLMRFLGLRPGDPAPGAPAIRLHRSDLAKAGVMNELLAEVRRLLDDHGYRARKDFYRQPVVPRWLADTG